ncbi:hypothetical protein [Dyadobacter sp. CY356]|uniref:hypothetical protein n=1 Tax=Dyadobacter sp. CY356 TaxID=2906442 RepID=UPI001F255610|nr:hypothetical protein [Dyadobacter sp. CY356]MCF0055500.1 hypothetical protein [Dyadobacter sp. CY356]
MSVPTNKPYSFNKADFKEAYQDLKATEGREAAIEWLLFNIELVEEALEIASEVPELQPIDTTTLKASIATAERIAKGEF